MQILSHGFREGKEFLAMVASLLYCCHNVGASCDVKVGFVKSLQLRNLILINILK